MKKLTDKQKYYLIREKQFALIFALGEKKAKKLKKYQELEKEIENLDFEGKCKDERIFRFNI